jgi:hypothetical protein
MIVNKPIGTFIVGEVNDITWDKATANWDTFYADTYYSQYIQSEFGVTIPSPPDAILWDHAVVLTVGFPSGYDYQDQQDEKSDKKKKRKIKVIFMMENKEEIFEKEKKTVKVEFKHQIENVLTEKFGQKVILEDVQIIHR